MITRAQCVFIAALSFFAGAMLVLIAATFSECPISP